MKEFFILLRKDLAIEFRTKEALIFQLTMSFLLCTVCAIGVHSAFLTGAQLKSVFPTLIWLVFIFSSTLSISRSFEYEFKNEAITGLLTAGVTPSLIFLSKFICNGMIVFVGQLLSIIVLALFLNLSLSTFFCEVLLITALISIGFSAVATLLIPISFSARLRSMLLPLILIPLLFPLIFSALELTSSVLDSASLDLGSFWISLIIGFDVIYITLGINLFETVILE